jgi:hypothetical protein
VFLLTDKVNIDWLIWSYACQLIAMRIYSISQARETSLDKNPSRTSFCSFHLVSSAKLAISKVKLVASSSLR